MNARLNLVEPVISQATSVSQAEFYCGKITALDENSKQWIVDDCHTVLTATSLLLTPEVGDSVYCVSFNGQYFITHILQRAKSDKPLMFESDRDINLSAPVVRLTGFKEIELLSLNRLSLMCKHGVFSMTETLISQAENFIQKAGHFSLTAKKLLRTHAKHQAITAEEDVRVDGKRINMG